MRLARAGQLTALFRWGRRSSRRGRGSCSPTTWLSSRRAHPVTASWLERRMALVAAWRATPRAAAPASPPQGCDEDRPYAHPLAGFRRLARRAPSRSPPLRRCSRRRRLRAGSPAPPPELTCKRLHRRATPRAGSGRSARPGCDPGPRQAPPPGRVAGVLLPYGPVDDSSMLGQACASGDTPRAPARGWALLVEFS
jgi:hypothetical protein